MTTTDREIAEAATLPNRLREWREGTHEVHDGPWPTGELVEEPKTFAVMQQERETAADVIDALLDVLEAAREAIPPHWVPKWLIPLQAAIDRYDAQKKL